MTPRKRVQALAQGRGAGEVLAVPLAFEVAANISARPIADFLNDATQLANGLLELYRAIEADGIVCAFAAGLERESGGGSADVERIAAGPRVAASLEACRRLRVTLGERAALVAGLTGPATLARQLDAPLAEAGAALVGLARRFCDAGVDILIVVEEEAPGEREPWEDPLRTTANVVRFHRGLTYLWGVDGPMPRPTRMPLSAPARGATGLVTTSEVIPRETSITTMRDWALGVKA